MASRSDTDCPDDGLTAYPKPEAQRDGLRAKASSPEAAPVELTGPGHVDERVPLAGPPGGPGILDRDLEAQIKQLLDAAAAGTAGTQASLAPVDQPGTVPIHGDGGQPPDIEAQAQTAEAPQGDEVALLAQIDALLAEHADDQVAAAGQLTSEGAGQEADAAEHAEASVAEASGDADLEGIYETPEQVLAEHAGASGTQDQAAARPGAGPLAQQAARVEAAGLDGRAEPVGAEPSGQPAPAESSKPPAPAEQLEQALAPVIAAPADRDGIPAAAAAGQLGPPAPESKAPVGVSTEAAARPGRVRPVVRIKLAGLLSPAGVRLVAVLRSGCTALNRPLAGLSPAARDLVGYIGVLTLFWSSLLLVGKLVVGLF